MKKTISLLCVVCSYLTAWAQPNNCSTAPMPGASYQKLMQETARLETYTTLRNSGVLRNVALNINIMVYDNGPITSVAFIQNQIDSANVYFANAGIEFSICNVTYIVNTSPLPFWDAQYEYQIAPIYDKPGYMNMYYVNYIANASAYAYYPYPGAPDRVIMGQNLSGEIFAHELGHSFSLIHTHGNYNMGNGTDELVNGSNCTTAADLICDTPADPNLYLLNRVDSLCNYIDTVSVDTMGFLYAPNTHNIMSYSLFKCFDMMTPMQYARIAYTLAHDRAYLKSGEQTRPSMTAPSSACIYDPTTVLTGTPSGGVFSGPGVSGNIFDPAAAGGGTHVITYSVTPGAAVESTDQYYQYSDTSYSTSSAWQSFTTAADETLSGCSFYLKSATSQSITLSVYDSVGTSGALLLQETISINSDSVFNWNKLTFQNPLHLNSGESYTVAITTPSPVELAGNKYDRYAGGVSSINYDLAFITHVIPDVSPCGNSVSAVIKVGAPPKPVITNLFEVYCSTAPAQLLTPVPGGGVITIDGVQDTMLNPVVLGAGLHSLHYTYTDNLGCTNDSLFSFIVNDTTAIINLPQILCTDNTSVTITAVPPGGNLYLDNILLAQPLINPSTLTPGPHSISYAVDAEYPWIELVDQNNLFTSFNQLYSLSFNQTAWQSFKAGIKGYLNMIDLKMYVSAPTQSNYKIYKGEGTAGAVLYSSTHSPAQQTYDQQYPFPANQVLLEKDSVYTFEFGINPIVNNITIPYKDLDPYPNGNCNLALIGLPGTDLSFATHMNSVYQCGQDSVISNFTVSPSPIVNLGNDTTLLAGQQILLNAGAGTTFTWSTGETTQTIIATGQTGVSTFYVTVTNPDGCTASDTININFVTGINEMEANFYITPNPVKDMLYVHSETDIEHIQVSNTLGQQVYQEQQPGTLKVFEISTVQLKAEVYFLHLKTKSKVFVYRFIKEE